MQGVWAKNLASPGRLPVTRTRFTPIIVNEMRVAALIDAASIGEYAFTPLWGGASACERALAFAASLPGFAGALVLEACTGPTLPPQPSGFRRERREPWTVGAILEAMEAFTADLGKEEEEAPIDAIVLIRADEPLLDPALARRMLENYRRYRADYSFADGYPLGLAAEMLHPRVLPALRLLAERNPLKVERGWLFALIQKDINSFDIETEISPRDLRDLRVSLACDTRRNLLLVDRFGAAGVRDAESALSVIPDHLELLRTLPAYVQVQVAGGCPQACALCPYPRFGGDILARRDYMPRARFAALMEALTSFAGEAVVSLSLWGEPALHPDFEGLVEDVLVHPGLSLIIETSGLGWRRDSLESLAARWGSGGEAATDARASRLSWVVALDAPEPELYARLRGKGYEEAVATAELLLSLFPKSAYVQTLRAIDNEDALEEFWRGWKKKTDNVIVQKYSTFAGFLPQRKVTDLSPLVRRPCWHLLRDLSILLDGTVPLCRECLQGEQVLGRLFDSGEGPVELARSLEAVWRAGEAPLARHIAGNYPEPCLRCDEYYTYNA